MFGKIKDPCSPFKNLELARDYFNCDESLTDCSNRLRVVGGIISPVSDAYRKPSLIEASHRINMCQLGCAGSEFIDIDPWESVKSTWTRTVDVLKYFDKTLNESFKGGKPIKVMLLAGSDLVEGFAQEHLWNPVKVREIIENFGLAVVERDSQNPVINCIQNSALFSSLQDNIFIINQLVFCQISSSKLRELIKSNRSIRYLTSDAIVDYIESNNLYR
jgi:nicotinamide mononucleotide adenylyltransferase